MRKNIKRFVELCVETLSLDDPIYDFGALQTPGQEGFADLRPFFPGKTYVGADMRPGVGVDCILDLHDIDLESESVRTVLCFDTLEHVEEPRRALQEIHRILQPGGVAIISSHMYFPIHDHPSDYWRFTPEAFRSILKPFEQSFAGYAGHELLPHTVVGVGFKHHSPDLTQFAKAYDAWQAEQRRGLKALAWNFMPPSFFPLLFKYNEIRMGQPSTSK